MQHKRYKKYFEAFNINDASKAMSLIIKSITKRTGMKIYASSIPTDFKNAEGSFSGVFCIVGNGNSAIRFNWNLGNSSGSIISVDFFFNQDFENPDLNIDTTELNAIQIISAVSQTLLTKQPGELVLVERVNYSGNIVSAWISDMKINDNSLSMTRFTDLYKDLQKWLRGHKELGNLSQASFNNAVKDYLDQKGLRNKFVRTTIVRKASKEKSIVNKRAEEMFDNAQDNFELSTSEKFEDLEVNLILLIRGHISGLTVTGTSGIGKTESVKTMLRNEGKSFQYFRGNIGTKYDLYKMLYETGSEQALGEGKDTIIIFDDMNDVLTKKDLALMMLSALDDTSGNIVPMLDQKFLDRNPDLPATFIFKGRVIFVTNLPIRKIAGALLSRAIPVELNLGADEVIDRIGDILKYVPPPDADIKQEVFDFLQANASSFSRIDFRSFYNICVYAASEHPLWKKMAITLLRTLSKVKKEI